MKREAARHEPPAIDPRCPRWRDTDPQLTLPRPQRSSPRSPPLPSSSPKRALAQPRPHRRGAYAAAGGAARYTKSETWIPTPRRTYVMRLAVAALSHGERYRRASSTRVGNCPLPVRDRRPVPQGSPADVSRTWRHWRVDVDRLRVHRSTWIETLRRSSWRRRSRGRPSADTRPRLGWARAGARVRSRRAAIRSNR